ncbi:MAG: hypothetical protein J6T70_07340 [Bacteroidales bacterium]|nr:hypothetical protein [Bacteroidales bacterium]
MKKLTLGFMAFALAAATLFSTSCKDDDDEEDNGSLAQITASGDINFSATAAARLTNTNDASATGSKFSLGELLGQSDTKTSIFGLNKDKQGIYITVNGTSAGDYKFGLDVNQNSATGLLIDYLTNGSIKETLQDAIDANTGCFIIYKASSAAEAGGDDYYASTKATVTMKEPLTVGKISYIQGSYTAELQNKSGNKLSISGSFKCPGLNSTGN